MARKKSVGWRNESARHAAAARGYSIRPPPEKAWEKRLDKAIENAYDIGFINLAHDIERGKIDKAIARLTEEVRIAEERDEPMMAITPMRKLIRELESL